MKVPRDFPLVGVAEDAGKSNRGCRQLGSGRAGVRLRAKAQLREAIQYAVAIVVDVERLTCILLLNEWEYLVPPARHPAANKWQSQDSLNRDLLIHRNGGIRVQ